MRDRFRIDIITISRLITIAILMLAVSATVNTAFANDWDERLEGTLPLPASYLYEVADPNSGITSVVTDTGDIALRLSDQSASVKQGRINRGNWANVSGVTLHARFRVVSGDANVMTLQLNDGMASGRLSLRWGSGQLNISNATPDAGQPASVPMPLGSWIEVWVKISSQRYWLYTVNNGQWTLASTGSTPLDSGGIVYIGSASNAGVGVMELDFYRLETTGGYAPGDAGAPCIAPESNLATGISENPVIVGQSTDITVASSQIGYLYQLRNSAGNVNVGSPKPGNGGTVTLPTGPLTSTTSFNVLVSSVSGNCSAQLPGIQTVTVANPCATIAVAKGYGDGTIIKLTDKPVSARGGGSYWIEEPDRSSGIRVNSNSLPAVGSKATVFGTLASTNGERRIDAIKDDFVSSNFVTAPLYLNNKYLGGTALNDYTRGITGSIGPNNIGLLVRCWGFVTSIADSFFYIDDGSGLTDETFTGVRIASIPGSLKVNDYTSVTGISSCYENASGEIRPVVVPIVGDCLLPNMGLEVSALATNVCYGQSTIITVAGSETGVNYQLRDSSGNISVGDPVAGTGGTISLPTGPITRTTTYNVSATRVAGGCAVQLMQTASVQVSALPNAGLTVAALANPLQSGESTSVTIGLSEIGVNYQLRNNDGNVNVGSAVTGTGGTIYLPTEPLAVTTTFNILATNAASGCSTQLTSLKTITVGATRSKFGVHVIGGPRNGFLPFLQTCSNAEHPLTLVKCLDDFGAANEAKQVNPTTLTVGRLNEMNGNDLQGLDYLVNAGVTPQDGAAWFYNQVKAKWQQNSWIDVWECFNEWSWHWDWQADFYIAMMDIAEAEGFRIALFSSSVGNPPEEYWPAIARACARAKAHGNHILSLHEYSLEGLLKDEYLAHGDNLVLRYRKLYNYLKTQNADCPLVLTEVGQNGGGQFCGVDAFVQDYAWYDSELRKDPYVIGCAAWLLGDSGWGGANFQDALPAMGEYIATH